MRIAIASSFGTAVAIWKRLADEGNDVLVWIGETKQDSPAMLTSHRKVGRGIVGRTDSWNTLLDWAKEGSRTGVPTLMVFDSSGLGKLADEARKAGIHVLGGGSFCDRLEFDRTFGKKIAQEAGCHIPASQQFASLDETISFARTSLDGPVYFKTDTYIKADATKGCDDAEELVEYLEDLKREARPNTKNILEEKIEGPALSTGRWWNGRTWIGPYAGDWEKKKFMADEIGPSTGCSLNAVWLYEDEDPLIARALCWDALAPAFVKHEAPPGFYDINAVLKGGKAYFLEWCGRFGYDSEVLGLCTLYDDLGAYLWQVATGQGDGGGLRDELALSIRVTVPPYPSEAVERDHKASCVGVSVKGDVGDLWSGGFIGCELQHDESGLTVAAAEGIVGLSAARGYSLEELGETTLEFAKKNLRVAGLQFRPDAAEVVASDTKKALHEGFDDLHEGLLA